MPPPVRKRTLFLTSKSSGPPVVQAGLLADYRFEEGFGSAVGDSSSYAYSGTLLSGAAWTQQGIDLTGGGVSLTVPLASVVTVQALVTPAVNCAGGVLLGSTTANRISWELNRKLPDTGTFFTVSPFTRCPTAGPSGGAVDPCYGPVAATWVSRTGGEGSDLWYVDGNAVYDYTTAATSGLDRIGSLKLFAFPGVIHRLLLYNTELSAASVAINSSALHVRLQQRGGPLAPVNGSTNRVLICVGDSITRGNGVSTPWPAAMTLAHTWDIWNFGIAGWRLSDVLSVWPAWYNPPYAPNAPVNACVIFAGTNDSGSAATIFARLVTAVADAQAGGWKVILVPVLNRAGGNAFGDTYNALLTGHSWPAGVTFVPLASLPDLVNDDDYLNTTYFQSDQLHPTQVGQNELAAGIAPLIDALG